MNMLTIVLMAVITFSSRYLMLHPKMPIKIGPRLSTFLSFSAPAVLTAIWLPIIFVQHGELNTSLTNPYLIAGTVAVLSAYKFKNVYLTMLISGALFVSLKVFI